MLNPKLAQQSLGRPLTPWEIEFAAALEAAFAAGNHDAAAVAAALTAAGVRGPDGSATLWSAASVQAALVAVNAGLDAAYAENGIGA